MPGRAKLTDRQQEVLDFIQTKIERDGYPPTIREIGAELGIRSTNGVNDHLKALERKGYINRDGAKSRTLVPVDAVDDSFIEVPILGRIAAGEPILAIEQAEDTVKIDKFFLGKNKEVFALRVVGQSMINDGIHDGDFIFVRKQRTAARGSIVVAMIDDEATVKRYFPEGDRIRFQPANDSMQPIYVAANEFRDTHILGVVVGVYRRMD
ncbi:MAG: repressor LexA [Deltaproteobacteria bacterium HGW-Deltaproteobacteria-14]|jgi:repressor LexA|nr:MAG: repressor LexA [Deltaproteobacteria bacterium HGW-Deltaproteobacteria-14]